MEAKRTQKKEAGAGSSRPLRQWRSQYPDYPDLTSCTELDDFEGIIHRVEEAYNLSSPRDMELHDAAILKRVIWHLKRGEPLHRKDAADLVERLYGVLAGMAWEDAFSLPGREVPREWHAMAPKDQRDLELYCHAENLRRTSDTEITKAIHAAADQHCVSYETARAAYYAWRARLAGRSSNFPGEIQKDPEP